MKDDRAGQLPHRAPLRWTLYALLTLYGGCLLSGLQAWWLGRSPGFEGMVCAAWTITLGTVVTLGFRTRRGHVAGWIALLLTFGLGLVGSDAVRSTILERHGERAAAVVTEVRADDHRAADSSCLLRTDDGRDVPRELAPCERFEVGDRLDVTYDPDGRQNPVVGVPDPTGTLGWSAGLLAALTLLVLSLPLWAGRGPRVRFTRDGLVRAYRYEQLR
ncbi:DUF3592 domain-containing protein [Kitasatospora phosalacinea]|uniref:DUF3592 domain-containing protein n=1 Tax=Kitasatospora phosalacinea TaxID=2065 RepID=UPI000524BFD4|nr:DUF3592 domain-containing protein [Kitasatospora phosalacinea]